MARHIPTLRSATIVFALLLSLAGALVPCRADGPVELPRPPAPIARGLVDETALAFAAEPPCLPDLSVLYISRTPRYAAYQVDYPSGLPTLRPGTEAEQRKPAPGELVTLTAHVKNQGIVAAPSTRYRWELDGTTIQSGTLPSLAGGETTTLDIQWPWHDKRHAFALYVDIGGAIAEVSETNNARTHVTSALYLAIDVDPLVYAAFRRRANLTGSWSFEDWLQAQIGQMNSRLAQARYPLAPNGVVDRVRVDQITIRDSRDLGDAVPQVAEFDGHWVFRVAEDDHHTPEDESALSAEEYARNYAGQIDWGLVHELTHQIGAIDLYRLNLEPGIGNGLSAGDGRPLLLGHRWPNAGLMGGGSTSPYDDATYYSSHTARGLQANQGHRRGYYGDYLFDLPAQVTLRLLDGRRLPVVDAQIDIFQIDGDVLPPEPVISGLTDSAGDFRLPNRSFDGQGLTTETGHVHAANPFGQIDVVGTNGLLLVRIRAPHAPLYEEYRWIEITDLNLAYWAGNTDAFTITLDTHYPSPAGPPPPDLEGEIEGSTVRLGWGPAGDAGDVTYRVYQALGPAFVFDGVADVGTALSWTGTLTDTSWFVVTATDGSGAEGSFSRVYRAPLLTRPVDIVLDPDTQTEIVLDRHAGGLFRRLPGGEWVGRQGSEHLGFVGATALTPGPGGLIGVAAADRRVSTVASDNRPVSQFYLGSETENPQAQVGGILLAGPAVDFLAPPLDDGRTTFLARFDGELHAPGQPPMVADGLSFVDGHSGEAVSINPGARLAYDADGRLLPEAGGLELWLRPHWPGRDWTDHVLIDAGDGASYRLLLVKDANAALYVWVEDYDKHDAYALTDVRAWEAGEWHHVAVTWNAERLDLTVDGRLQDTHPWRHAITGTVDAIWLGSDRYGDYAADADYDELRVSDHARWGNTDSSRVIVSNAGQDRLAVYDLLGNRISEFGASGTAPGQFRGPTAMAWLDAPLCSRLLVIDRDNGRVQRLSFDGQRLRDPLAVATNLGLPTSLAVGPGETFLVSELTGDRVSLLNMHGQVLRTWDGPTDGHGGAFEDPHGMAVRRDGSVLVADTGNARVVGIAGVFSQKTLLPLLAR